MEDASFSASLRHALHQRQSQQLYRHRHTLNSPQQPTVNVDGKSCLSFCSNDYLGLANHPDVTKAFIHGVKKYGVGSGASHLVSGHNRAHAELEEALAEFTGRERVLLFSSGYMANVGVLTALAGKGDQVFEDRLNHASLLDGGLFSGARFSRYAHLDTDSLQQKLSQSEQSGRTFIVTDGVFSMDGDIAPLPELAKLAQEHNAVLMVDDAHGFGCLGKKGEGSIGLFNERGHSINQDNCQILIGTFGKAFGTSGAFVAGSEELIETLIQFCRPYIYTTAQPPAVSCATLKSLELLQKENWPREWLQAMVLRFRQHCSELGFTLSDSFTPIQAIVLGDESRALTASKFLEEQGILISAIRPPTVPVGTSRLRVTFSAAHTEEEFTQMLSCLTELAGELAS